MPFFVQFAHALHAFLKACSSARRECARSCLFLGNQRGMRHLKPFCLRQGSTWVFLCQFLPGNVYINIYFIIYFIQTLDYLLVNSLLPTFKIMMGRKCLTDTTKVYIVLFSMTVVHHHFYYIVIFAFVFY